MLLSLHITSSIKNIHWNPNTIIESLNVKVKPKAIGMYIYGVSAGVKVLIHLRMIK